MCFNFNHCPWFSTVMSCMFCNGWWMAKVPSVSFFFSKFRPFVPWPYVFASASMCLPLERLDVFAVEVPRCVCSSTASMCLQSECLDVLAVEVSRCACSWSVFIPLLGVATNLWAQSSLFNTKHSTSTFFGQNPRREGLQIPKYTHRASHSPFKDYLILVFHAFPCFPPRGFFSNHTSSQNTGPFPALSRQTWCPSCSAVKAGVAC